MRRPQKLGARREILILLPATLLLLVLISTFTLLSLRSALFRWQEERRDEAASIADRLVRELAGFAFSGGAPPTEADLARVSGPLRAFGGSLAVVDGHGTTLTQIGPFTGFQTQPLDAVKIDGRVNVSGPLETGSDHVVAWAALRGAERRLVVELPAATLASQLRAVRRLTWFVVPVNTALLLLALFSLQQILGPWERLLARAEQTGTKRAGEEDEVDFLLATFERALANTQGPAAPERVEEDLATLERTLAPGLESGLLLLDSQGEVLALNELGSALLGLPSLRAGQEARTNVRDLLGDRPEALELVVSAIESGTGIQREEVILESFSGSAAPTGRQMTLGLSVHPLRRVDGGIRGYLVLFSDLTEVRLRGERERMAEGLTQLGEMAAGVAHEMRNGLATLRGYLTLIDRRPAGESVGEYLAEIRRESDHLERVASDFLEFARPGSAQLRPLALDDLLARAAHDPALGDFTVHVGGERGLTVMGDEPLLTRALRNLLLNAVQAERQAKSGGPIEISVKKTSENVIALEIADRGPGLPAEVREHLFQPFVTGRPGGVGLGLSLAYRIAVLHCGTLDLADREGGGTVATLALPSA